MTSWNRFAWLYHQSVALGLVKSGNTVVPGHTYKFIIIVQRLFSIQWQQSTTSNWNLIKQTLWEKYFANRNLLNVLSVVPTTVSKVWNCMLKMIDLVVSTGGDVSRLRDLAININLHAVASLTFQHKKDVCSVMLDRLLGMLFLSVSTTMHCICLTSVTSISTSRPTNTPRVLEVVFTVNVFYKLPTTYIMTVIWTTMCLLIAKRLGLCLKMKQKCNIKNKMLK